MNARTDFIFALVLAMAGLAGALDGRSEQELSKAQANFIHESIIKMMKSNQMKDRKALDGTSKQELSGANSESNLMQDSIVKTMKSHQMKDSVKEESGWGYGDQSPSKLKELVEIRKKKAMIAEVRPGGQAGEDEEFRGVVLSKTARQGTVDLSVLPVGTILVFLEGMDLLPPKYKVKLDPVMKNSMREVNIAVLEITGAKPKGVAASQLASGPVVSPCGKDAAKAGGPTAWAVEEGGLAWGLAPPKAGPSGSGKGNPMGRAEMLFVGQPADGQLGVMEGDKVTLFEP